MRTQEAFPRSAPPGNPGEERLSPWVAALLLALAMVPHLPYLLTYFFLDDFWHLAYLMRGEYVFSTWQADRQEIDALWYMSREVFPNMAWVERIVFYFRPLFVASVALDHALFGFWAPGYHLHSLLWHALNGALLFRLLVALKIGPKRALAGAALFLLHPMAMEPAGWISARCDLIVTSLSLGALLFHLRFRETRRWRDFVPVLLLFGLGLLTHEHAVALGPVLLLDSLLTRFLPGGTTRPRGDRAWIGAAFLTFLGLVYAAWRMTAHNEPGSWKISTGNFDSFMLFCPLPALGFNLLQYTWEFLLGAPPSSFFSGGPMPSKAVLVLIAVAAAAGGAVGMVRWRRHPQRLLLMWAGAFVGVILWIPATGRYLYPAAPGLFGLLTLALVGVPWGGRVRRGVLAGVLTIWIGLSGANSVSCWINSQVLEGSILKAAEEVRRRPEVTDLYLLHLWPFMVHMHGFIPVLAERPNLKVHVLTFSSTMYFPQFPEEAADLAPLLYPVPPEFFKPLDIRTRRLESNILDLVSEPVGFFAGPARFGWNSSTLPPPPKGDIQLKEMSVRFGGVDLETGVRRLMFTFPRPLDDPKNLWMEWKNGELHVWTP